ncbi:MAG: hypothetical protein ABIY52_09270 [Gemmatimonadaceae bacterium]
MLAPLRQRGNHGTLIHPHRAIATVRVTALDILLAIVLTLGTTVAVGASFGRIGQLWTWMFTLLAEPLGFSGGVVSRTISDFPFTGVAVPAYAGMPASPAGMTWWVTLVVTIVVLAGSLLMRRGFLPLAYALRLCAFIQATALVFFHFAPARFPYTLQSYTSSMLMSGMAVMAAVPLTLGLTFYLMDVGIIRKIGVTVAMLVHLLVFIPLQYMVQSYVIAHGSLLLMPLLFMLFGLVPEVMILIALYGWGMSWRVTRVRAMRE